MWGFETLRLPSPVMPTAGRLAIVCIAIHPAARNGLVDLGN
jgi:hypothetical protein